MSETAKHQHLVLPYLIGNGVDIGSGGWPVKQDGCISLELPQDRFAKYNGVDWQGIVHYRGLAEDLPFKEHSLDWVYSSHLLEDFPLNQWLDVLGEWIRVLKPGGLLVILVPEREAWAAAVAAGQPPNDAHQHEPYVGELTTLTETLGITALRDELIPGDYSILFVGRK